MRTLVRRAFVPNHQRIVLVMCALVLDIERESSSVCTKPIQKKKLTNGHDFDSTRDRSIPRSLQR